jgi:hypothetical protein
MPWVRDGALALALLGVACQGDANSDDSASTDASSSTDGSSESTAGSSDDSGSGDESGTTGEAVYGSFDERPCPPDSGLTWENFGGGYVLSYCTTCHHSALPADMRQLAPIAINFETVELVRAQAERIWTRAADQNQTMPPVGAPADDQRALLGEWLACGAPTNADLGME